VAFARRARVPPEIADRVVGACSRLVEACFEEIEILSMTSVSRSLVDAREHRRRIRDARVGRLRRTFFLLPEVAAAAPD
jgi:hypothetical protein